MTSPTGGAAKHLPVLVGAGLCCAGYLPFFEDLWHRPIGDPGTRYDRRRGEKIAIIDSLWTTMAMGLPVLTAPACQKVAEHACTNTGVLFVVETLEFMRRGGRIGGAQALLGAMLNIKPVLEIRAGRIEAVEKVRTKQKAIQHMLDLVTGRLQGKTSIHLAVTHANAESEALSLLESARTRLHPVETFTCPWSPVIGAHVGPGTLALNYMSGVA